MWRKKMIEKIGEALSAVVPNTYHYWRPGLSAPFCVWSEDSGRSLNSDNGSRDFAHEGTVDYFTKEEFDPAIDLIQSALGEVCTFYLNSVQYEEETGLIHHEWAWLLYG